MRICLNISEVEVLLLCAIVWACIDRVNRKLFNFLVLLENWVANRIVIDVQIFSLKVGNVDSHINKIMAAITNFSVFQEDCILLVIHSIKIVETSKF